jgi:Aminoglycoside-2''-adenylyltransferase
VTSLVERQLAAIAEVREVSRRLAIDVWLRGGWAVDFSVGRVTREHADVDWFVWAGHLPAIVASLGERGWDCVDADAPGPHRTLAQHDVHMSFLAMAPGAGATPIVADGPLAGEYWPASMIAGARVGRIGAQDCLTISPDAQLRLKQMTPRWFPGRTTRPKDLEDIAQLESARQIRA